MLAGVEKSVKILRASAGSGKTYRLAYEYIKRVVENPESYLSILAVTFTNKATEEMKRRILSALNTLATSKPGDKTDYIEELKRETGLAEWQIIRNADIGKTLILHDYSNFAVSTIDTFFQRIARSFFKELGLDFSYEVELSGDSYLERAVINLIEQSTTNPELSELIDLLVGDEIENGKWNIKDKLVATGHRVLLSEGYTKPTLQAWALIGIMREIQTVVDTEKQTVQNQASEILTTIAEQGLTANDFKGSSTSFVQAIIKIAAGIIGKEIPKKLLNASENPEGEWFSKTSTARRQLPDLIPTLSPILTQLTENIGTYITLRNSFVSANKHFHKSLLLSLLSKELDILWGQDNRLPIHRTTELIADIVSTTDIPFIYEKIGTRYDCYMIDEFQDTSRGQWQGFKPLLHETVSRTAAQSVLLIGDVKQAIYRFRGGDWNILSSDAPKEFGDRADDAESLDTNWRSLPHIVEFNNHLLEAVIDTENRNLRELTDTHPSLQTAYQDLLSKAYNRFKQTPDPNTNGGYARVDITETPADKTLEIIHELITLQNFRQRDIAILIRQKSQGKAIAATLIGAGYSVISEEALNISNSQTVQFIVAVLRYALLKEDTARSEINLFLKQPLNDPLSPEINQFLEKLALTHPIFVIEQIIEYFHLKDSDPSYTQSFYQTLYDFIGRKSADLKLFLDWWDKTGCNTTLSLPKGQDSITIITIHKAKGLQFPAVILPWADWDLMPQRGSTTWASTHAPLFASLGQTLVTHEAMLNNSYYSETYIHESIYSHIDNINLLYVAITRAEKELYILTPPTEKNNNRVSWLINTAVTSIQGITTELSPDSKLVATATYGEHYICPPHIPTVSPSMILTDFESTTPMWRLAAVMPHRRYSDDGMDNHLQRLGIIMHELFSTIQKLDELDALIDIKVIAGEISTADSAELKRLIAVAIQDETVNTWFSSRWNSVYTERNIVIPAQSAVRRPDRVMISGNSATIVDFKFGKKHAVHRQQIIEYGELMTQMNYPNVQMYLWYVLSGEVLSVTF